MRDHPVRASVAGSGPRCHRERGESHAISSIIAFALLVGIGWVWHNRDSWSDRIALADVPAAPWFGDDPEKWPDFVLTNSATFKGHSPLKAGTAFLIEYGDGKIAGATARHLISEDCGVTPTVRLSKLDREWNRWEMLGMADPSRAIELEGLLGDSGEYDDHDAVFLRVRPGGDTPPVKPLRLFRGQVAEGERVHVVAWAVGDGEGSGSDDEEDESETEVMRQGVYGGKVVSVSHLGERITLLLDRPVVADGFSGAPIINEKGYAIGILTAGIPTGRPGAGDRIIIAQGLRPLRGLFPE